MKVHTVPVAVSPQEASVAGAAVTVDSPDPGVHAPSSGLSLSDRKKLREGPQQAVDLKYFFHN